MPALPTVRGYRVLEHLGHGAMGEVFLAEDETLQRRVAIKMIAPRLGAKRDARSRFLREARAMAGVEHPRVVRIYAFGEVRGQPYIVMEYVPGETLAARLTRPARLAVDEALRITREVAQALAAAWSRGIVHRDVKPANILLDGDQHVKVADFGLARTIAGGSEATGAHVVVGTPHYMSPEQARGQATDFRSDIYSLGVVLYEMLGGQKPFAGRSPVEVMAQHLSAPLPPIRRRCPDVPPAVATLVESMTAKAPQSRPESYAALLRDLAGGDRAHAGETAATSSMPSLPGGTRRPRRRRLARVLVGTALVLLALALAFVLRPWKARHGSFAVAVAPFYGTDPESEREGRVFTTLVESELARRLPDDDVDVRGADGVRTVVRTARAARTLARKLDVDALVWGEALAFHGEVEVAARITRRDGTLLEMAAADALVAAAPNAIAQRRARAVSLVDEVAGIYRPR